MDERLRPLLRFDVMLWPDNDMPGERDMVRIAERLSLMGKTAYFVRWSDAPAAGDAADFGGDDASLHELVNKAERWQPNDLATPLPQSELGEWLDEVAHFVRRYVVLNDDQLCAIALWVAHTHVFVVFDATPYLLITSAEKRSGKTRLLEVLDLLVRQAWMTGRVTGALLARKIARALRPYCSMKTMLPSMDLKSTSRSYGRFSIWATAVRGSVQSSCRRDVEAGTRRTCRSSARRRWPASARCLIRCSTAVFGSSSADAQSMRESRASAAVRLSQSRAQ